MLSTKGITVHYGKAIGICDISLEVAEGTVVCLLGANGAGKSTLFRALSGLVPVSCGEIWFLGKRIDNIEAFRRVECGLVQVAQGRHLFPGLSVIVNLRLGAVLRKDKVAVRRDLDEIFEYFPILWERRNQKAGTLSGGEQQMLAMGRALMAKPRLLLMDEPSLGLAPKIVLELAPIIRRIKQRGISVILAEQNVSLAFMVATKAHVLEMGKIVAEGYVEDIKDIDVVKRAYLGG